MTIVQLSTYRERRDSMMALKAALRASDKEQARRHITEVMKGKHDEGAIDGAIIWANRIIDSGGRLGTALYQALKPVLGY